MLTSVLWLLIIIYDTSHSTVPDPSILAVESDRIPDSGSELEPSMQIYIGLHRKTTFGK